MKLRADFTKREVVDTLDEAWVPSPMAGVDRLMLDRIGEEVARATSLVRYAPNSTFSEHTHTGGEEFLVLDGVFNDEHGSYPKGTYVRNPIGTAHSPHVKDEGCTILVKLHQFDETDTQPVSIDTKTTAWTQTPVDGVSVMSLHDHPSESVMLIRIDPNTTLDTRTAEGGSEVLVLEGAYSDENGRYPAGTWLRNPRGASYTPSTGTEGVTMFVKNGHLPE